MMQAIVAVQVTFWFDRFKFFLEFNTNRWIFHLIITNWTSVFFDAFPNVCDFDLIKFIEQNITYRKVIKLFKSESIKVDSEIYTTLFYHKVMNHKNVQKSAFQARILTNFKSNVNQSQYSLNNEQASWKKKQKFSFWWNSNKIFR